MGSEAAAKQEATPTTTVMERTTLDPHELIQSALTHGAGIEALERLVALAKDVRAQQASEAWHGAMAEFQAKCPVIEQKRTANIATRTGPSYSFGYAKLPDIMKIILPVMGELGLSVSFRVHHKEKQVLASCRISHELGHHEESGPVGMPIVFDDRSAATPHHRVGIASTYAKRYALLAITGIAPVDEPGSDMTRNSAVPAAVAKPATWMGFIKKVVEKSGDTGGKPWTYWAIFTKDDCEFRTFKKADAEFARQAGSSPVRIVWEEGLGGSSKVISIEPHTGA